MTLVELVYNPVVKLSHGIFYTHFIVCSNPESTSPDKLKSKIRVLCCERLVELLLMFYILL